jgi:CRISPR-associated endoribonuclease Cas6
MYFVAIILKLRCQDKYSNLTIADNVYLHAAIHRAITDHEAHTGRKLHDMRRNKLLTMAIVDNTRYTATVRLTFMAYDGLMYAETFINALQSNPRLRLGKAIYGVTAINLAMPPLAGVCTWADFMVTATQKLLVFHFCTPTAISKRDDCKRRFMSLFPEPGNVFTGLARRWQALGGPELPDVAGFIQRGGCVVSNYEDLNTIELRIEQRIQLGFVGHVVYECRHKDTAYVVALNALTRLAYFTGVGYQTTRGLGYVETETSG